VCDRGPRELRKGPGGKGLACLSCYTVSLRKRKIGTCPICQGEKPLTHRNPDDKKQAICYACHSRIKRYRAKGISRSLPLLKIKKEKVGIRNKYPTKESVEEEIKKRAERKEESNATLLNKVDATLYRAARKFGVALPKKKTSVARRKGRPAKLAQKPIDASSLRLTLEVKLETKKRREKERSAIEELMTLFLNSLKNCEVGYLTDSLAVSLCHQKLGQNNHNSAFIRRSLNLLSATALEEVMVDKISYPWRYFSREKMEEMIIQARTELLGEGTEVVYKCGQLVENINPRDPSIYGRIGDIVVANSEEVKVDFREKRVIRVYKGDSLLYIVPYNGKTIDWIRRFDKERALSD